MTSPRFLVFYITTAVFVLIVFPILLAFSGSERFFSIANIVFALFCLPINSVIALISGCCCLVKIPTLKQYNVIKRFFAFSVIALLTLVNGAIVFTVLIFLLISLLY